VHQPSQGRKGGAALQKNLLGGALCSTLVKVPRPTTGPNGRNQHTGTALSTPLHPLRKLAFTTVWTTMKTIHL
jgi:hypothetical protein